jgi:hypothetical protein
MSGRIEFNKKCEEILDFVDAYGVLRYEHIEKFYPGSKKVVSYLIKNQRLHKSADGAYISTGQDPRPDKSLIAALGVLADVLEKVQAHARATLPAHVSFITHNDDYYEIIYVGYGMEVMTVASFKAQLAAKHRPAGCADTVKRIVIVEDKSQMERLQIPGISRFALIQPDGSLSYFKGG